MKYLCDDKDHASIERKGFARGRADAERMIADLLNGTDQLRISKGTNEYGLNEFRPLGSKPHDENNIWFRLRKRLNRKGNKL